MADFLFRLSPVEQVGIEVDGALETTVLFQVAAVMRGEKGDTGDGGPGAGPIQALVANAGAALGGHRVVGINHAGDYTYVDPTVRADGFRAAGMTTGAAASGTQVTVQTRGPVTEPSWSWTPDQPVYVGANGVPTQTVPTGAAFVMVIGVALSATSMFIQFSNPIFL